MSQRVCEICAEEFDQDQHQPKQVECGCVRCKQCLMIIYNNQNYFECLLHNQKTFIQVELLRVAYEKLDSDLNSRDLSAQKCMKPQEELKCNQSANQSQQQQNIQEEGQIKHQQMQQPQIISEVITKYQRIKLSSNIIQETKVDSSFNAKKVIKEQNILNLAPIDSISTYSYQVADNMMILAGGKQQKSNVNEIIKIENEAVIAFNMIYPRMFPLMTYDQVSSNMFIIGGFDSQ